MKAFSPQGLLADQIRLAREQKGWSQQHLAQQADVPQSQISKLERALIEDPGFFTVKSISRALDIELGMNIKLPVAAHPIEVPANMIPLGLLRTETGAQEVGIDPQDLKKHMFITGRTGTGKSVLLQSMFLHLARSSKSPAVFIDRFSENGLYDLLLYHLPERQKDIVHIDVSDGELAYNPLDVHNKKELEQTLVWMMEVMHHQLGLAGGIAKPRVSNYIQIALTALMEANLELKQHKCTLLHVLNFLRDDVFRHLVVSLGKNPSVRELFDPVQGTYEELSSRQQEEHVSPITRIILPLVHNETTFSILRHDHNKIQWNDLIQEGKIIILTGRHTQINFVHDLLTTHLLQTMENWQTQGKGARIFVDEAHSMLGRDGDSASAVLAKARKYDIGLIAATQYPQQFSSGVEKAMYANTASKISLSLDAAGIGNMATSLSSPNEPVNRADIASLPNYTAIANWIVNGKNTGPVRIDLGKHDDVPREDRKKLLEIKLADRARLQGVYYQRLFNNEAVSYADRLKVEMKALVELKVPSKQPWEW